MCSVAQSAASVNRFIGDIDLIGLIDENSYKVVLFSDTNYAFTINKDFDLVDVLNVSSFSIVMNDKFHNIRATQAMSLSDRANNTTTCNMLA